MKRLQLWLRLLLSSLLIIFLLYTVDLQDVAANAARGNYWYVLVAFVLGIGDRILMAYKWNILLRAKGVYLSLKSTVVTYLTTTFLGLVLPATVGGDALRAYAVAKEGYPASDVISSIVVERVLGLMALMAFVMGSIVLSVYVFGQGFFTNIWGLFWAVSIAFILGVGLLLTSLNKFVSQRLLALLERWEAGTRISGIVKVLKRIYRSYLSYRNHKAELSVFSALTYVENLFPILWGYCLSLAFNIEVPLLYFFILVPIALALRRLPISIDGVGIHEGAFVYFLSLIGLAKSEALWLGIATHLLAIAIILPGGILYAFVGLRADESERNTGRTFEAAVEVPTDISGVN